MYFINSIILTVVEMFSFSCDCDYDYSKLSEAWKKYYTELGLGYMKVLKFSYKKSREHKAPPNMDINKLLIALPCNCKRAQIL